jgi:hypothetical protein
MVPGEEGPVGVDIVSMSTAEERRASQRFPIERHVRFKVRGVQPALAGTGTTVNMSSGGVLFTTDQHLRKGCPVMLEIRWPVLLDDVRPLKLVTRGPIIWCGGGRAAMHIQKWEFHTQSATSE